MTPNERLPITIRLDHFEGPLDLLLHLIQAHELDVSKISIGRITDQYLAFVKLMQELNFEIASEFLVMAATLLLWKSRALLPAAKGPDAGAGAGDDALLSPEELVRRLKEHQRFRDAGSELSRLPLLGEHVFVRNNLKPPTERVWRETSVSDLVTTYQQMIARARKRTQVLQKETVSLADKIAEFAERLEVGTPMALRALLSAVPARAEIVVGFLASLELSRLRKLRVHQEGVYQPIYVELLESLKGFNLGLATGFSQPVESPASQPPQPQESELAHG